MMVLQEVKMLATSYLKVKSITHRKKTMHDLHTIYNTP